MKALDIMTHLLCAPVGFVTAVIALNIGLPFFFFFFFYIGKLFS